MEYGREGQVSRKGDIYSYGIMLMETFTRKKPTDEIFVGEMSLKRWVNDALNNRVVEVVDTDLLRREDEHFAAKEECVLLILSLAMECTRELPEERIDNKEAVRRLGKNRVKLLEKIQGTLDGWS
ncbi:Receptor-like protein kinase [Melia azedarach]|uniref:Receptor-like protein kinase n=1 Tax=Melia azedarach TaxID=155640 RepID=A0ACC1WWQ8_MELAZ|nr:Receptor-like protein kinase [Melia azedarach]